jgi:hypothetical protein
VNTDDPGASDQPADQPPVEEPAYDMSAACAELDAALAQSGMTRESYLAAVREAYAVSGVEGADAAVAQIEQLFAMCS